MAIDRTYHCDAPDCEVHATTAAQRPPVGFIRTYESPDGPANHFCGWECVMRFAASKEPPEEGRL